MEVDSSGTSELAPLQAHRRIDFERATPVGFGQHFQSLVHLGGLESKDVPITPWNHTLSPKIILTKINRCYREIGWNRELPQRAYSPGCKRKALQMRNPTKPLELASLRTFFRGHSFFL